MRQTFNRTEKVSKGKKIALGILVTMLIALVVAFLVNYHTPIETVYTATSEMDGDYYKVMTGIASTIVSGLIFVLMYLD